MMRESDAKIVLLKKQKKKSVIYEPHVLRRKDAIKFERVRRRYEIY